MRTPMGFQSDEAFEFLEENGFVYSFRTKKREYEGDVWVRRQRGGKKEFDANVTLIKEVDAYLDVELEPFADCSGLEDVFSWIATIVQMHGEIDGQITGYIFKVERGEE